MAGLVRALRGCSLCAFAPRTRTLCSRGADDGVDYFAVLGVERRYDVDADKLATAYKGEMLKCHPDRFVTSSAAELDAAQKRSAVVTHAYSVLRRPHTRASHLLDLLGGGLVPAAAEQPAEHGGAQQLVSMEFLMQVMELRERIEHAGRCEQQLGALIEETSRLSEANAGHLAYFTLSCAVPGRGEAWVRLHDR